MISIRKAYWIAGDIGALASAALLVRGGCMVGGQISIMETGFAVSGSLNGSNANRRCPLRDGRTRTTDSDECTRDLYKSIPSLAQTGRSVFKETVDFNKKHASNAMA